jgi:hypothetical protein
VKRGNRFLLACIRLWDEENEPAMEEVRELAASVPEELLYSVARDSTLAPIVYNVMWRHALLDLLPDPLKEQLLTFYHFTAARNAMIFRNLSAFLDGAQRRSFPVMLLKGVALIAAGYYPNKGLRFLSDLDVLVRLDDIGAADDLLYELGWHAPVRITLDRQLSLHHHLSTVTTQEGIPVDVHFRLCRHPLKIDLEEMWRRSRNLSELSPVAFAPSPEDLLIHLALNTSMHHPDRILQLHLKFLADLEALMSDDGKSAFDWDYIFRTVSDAGMEVAVLHPLVLSYRLLGQKWLGDALAQHGALDRVCNDFINYLADDIYEGHQIPTMSWMVARMGEAGGLRDKIGILLRIIFPRRAEMAETHPRWAESPWFFLAYLQRLGHLLSTFRWRNFSLAYRAGSVLREKPPGQKVLSSDR